MIGRMYRYLRASRYMTQEYVAGMIGISRFTLSRYETGIVEIPITVALKLNKIYGLQQSEVDSMKL